MSPRTSRISLAVALMAVMSLPATAQPNDRPPESPRATELGVLVGGAASSGAGVVAAGVAGWEMNRWSSIEARGSWFGLGDGSRGFAADVGALVNVIARQDITPYVGASYGFYLAVFDSPTTPMPPFYRRRIAAEGRPERSMFTDPALRLTAGVEILGARNITVRPEASSIVMWRDGRSEAMVLIGVRVGYRFEGRAIR